MSAKQIATLAGGCFWCLEAVFELLPGVGSVVSGYIGGQLANPSYEDVCTGKTGHAEAVQISFDAGQVSFAELLAVFFAIHDPTTLNRQGNDVGTQYRSAIFYHNETQRTDAQTVIADLNGKHIWPSPLVTELVAAPTFYPAEIHHQHYFSKHPEQGYCRFVIAPKVDKFRKYVGRL
ncbi:MAG: peptide-methionine (S)-S-oxide reductase [Gallionellaceae bacterium]|nr:MAG: peptide-methionine (S)-S-oxide reductase [Gallionellaceae bacterium]